MTEQNFIERQRPAGDPALRRALYDGRVFLLPPTPASLTLAREAQALVEAELGPSARAAHTRFGDEELFARVGRLRRAIYCELRFHSLLRELAASAGFPAADTAFDPARLRVVAHDAFKNPRAAPVYYPHRDTWYGHPPSVVTIWLALDDLRADETFVFYPERFSTPVPNDSEVFDYDEWVARGYGLKIGWQHRDASLVARYPGVVGAPDGGAAVGFACRAGEVLLFSGAHFHRTLPQSFGTIRFSLDARLVHLPDHELGLGAPNVDGRARGSALQDYLQPSSDALT
jgi:hypothetical protein